MEFEFTSQTLPKANPKNPIRGVYLIKNTISNNCYIGSSIDIIRRLRAHLTQLRGNRHHNHRFQGAWNKYGEINFRFLIIEIVPDDIQVTAREDAWFAFLSPTYNISSTSAATPMLGRKHRPESIALMSEKKKGKSIWPNGRPPMSLEQRAKLSLAHKGKLNPSAKRPRTADEKANLSKKARLRFAAGPSANPRARPIELDGVIYQTGAEAAIALGISHSSIIRFIKRGRGRYLDGFPAGETAKTIRNKMK